MEGTINYEGKDIQYVAEKEGLEIYIDYFFGGEDFEPKTNIEMLDMYRLVEDEINEIEAEEADRAMESDRLNAEGNHGYY